MNFITVKVYKERQSGVKNHNEVTQFVKQLLHATAPAAYAHAFSEMKAYIMSNNLKDHVTWLDWWDKTENNSCSKLSFP